MREIHYYVAISLNGFIESKQSSIQLFSSEGEHVKEYLKELENYSDVILGRNTYEFGFQFGLKPGERAYPWMDHFLVSDRLDLDAYGTAIQIIRSKELQKLIDELRQRKDEKNIYLCGGGKLAGLLWEIGAIDRLILKVNPLILSQGTPLFEQIELESKLKWIRTRQFDSGVLFLEYERSFNDQITF